MNPYFLAWLKAGGMCQPLYKYINWIQEKHREYRAINKIPLEGYMLSKQEIIDFINYINIGPNLKP